MFIIEVRTSHLPSGVTGSKIKVVFELRTVEECFRKPAPMGSMVPRGKLLGMKGSNIRRVRDGKWRLPTDGCYTIELETAYVSFASRD
jgi:hypothetical protein